MKNKKAYRKFTFGNYGIHLGNFVYCTKQRRRENFSGFL